ncbi:hypothetical protein BDF22DRAFT_656383 [Syncephalis plumigaleata]|nr:hypothetical protein BDF22DRAFT_656383 [Syncephalis plumigaleata]
MSIQANESSPSIISFGHDWGLSTSSVTTTTTANNTTSNTTSSSSNNNSNSKHSQHNSVDKLAVTHNNQNIDFYQSIKKQESSSSDTITKKPFSTGIPSDLPLASPPSSSSSSILIVNQKVDSTTITSSSSTTTNTTPTTSPTIDRSFLNMASSKDKSPNDSPSSPLPEQVLKSTNEFPPLPTQEDAPPPSSPPLPNGESYAQATKHNIASESEEPIPAKPRKRSRGHPFSIPSRGRGADNDDNNYDNDDDDTTKKCAVAAKTWFGVGVVAAALGKLLLNRSNQQSGKPLLVGGVVTAFVSGLSWVWLRRSSSSSSRAR